MRARYSWRSLASELLCGIWIPWQVHGTFLNLNGRAFTIGIVIKMRSCNLEGNVPVNRGCRAASTSYPSLL